MKWKDLRLIPISAAFFYWAAGCGTPPADENISIPQEQKKTFGEKKSFALGESLDISGEDVGAITVLSRVGIHCGLKRSHEYSCQLNVENDEEREGILELHQGHLSFKQPGDFLVKVIRRDRSEKIFWLRVDDRRQRVLQESFDFRLVNQHDSFYPMLSHFELRALFDGDVPTSVPGTSPEIEVKWSVEGGRYHILDEELPVISVLRPFQKSVLFRERQRYEVRASVFVEGQKRFEKKTIVDFRNQFWPSDAVRVRLSVERAAAAVGQWVAMRGEADTNIRDLHYVWDVRKMDQTHCPEAALAYEETQRLNVSMARLKVCESDYEEQMYLDQDYLLDQQRSDHTVIRFKNPGQYKIILKVHNGNGDELGQSNRKLTVGSERLSSAR